MNSTKTYLVKKIGISRTLLGKRAMMNSKGFNILVILILVKFSTNGADQARKQGGNHTNEHEYHTEHTKSFRRLAWNVSRHIEKCKTHLSSSFCLLRILRQPLLRRQTLRIEWQTGKLSYDLHIFSADRWAMMLSFQNHVFD